MPIAPATTTHDSLRLVVRSTPASAGAAAARHAAAVLRAAIDRRGRARAVFAAAPSQEEFLAHLRAEPDIDWLRVQAFHMDEYLGLPPAAPQSFARWLTDRLPPVQFEAIDAGAEPLAEARRYAELLAAEQLDLTCLGIGVNGHIAFNEPDQCRFDDPESVRVVTLDETSRRQQVDDGCFATVDQVPRHALTLTVPALLKAATVVGVVPGKHKAPAVARMVADPIAPACPATALRTHPEVIVYLDTGAASRLSTTTRS